MLSNRRITVHRGTKCLVSCTTRLIPDLAATCIALARGQRKFAEIYSEFSLKAGKRWIEKEFE